MTMALMAERSIGLEIGARLRAERKRRGWSQEQLAIQAGVKRTWIAALETGGTEDPGTSSLLAVARALGVDLDYLASGRRSSDDRDRTALRRLGEHYSDEELSRLERAAAALFVKAERVAGDQADSESRGEGDKHRPDAGTDSD